MSIEKSTNIPTRLKDFMNNIPLTRKAALLIVTCIILPLSLLNYIYVYYSRQDIINKTINDSEIYMQQIVSNLDNYLSTYKDIATIRYLDKNLREFMFYNYQLDTIEGMRKYIDAYQYIDNMLKGILLTRSEIVRATLYIQPNILPTENYDVKYLDEACETKSWYRQLKTSTTGIAIVSEYDEGEQKEYLYMASFLGLRDLDYPYGVMLFQIDEERLLERIFPQNYKGDLYIYDYDKEILISTNKDKETIDLEEYMITRNIYEDTGGIDVLFDQDKRLIITSTLSNYFGLINIIEQEEYIEKVNERIFTIQIIILAISIFFISMIGMSIKLFVKGLQDIMVIIQQIDTENLDVTVPNKRKDEIGSIINCIIEMSKRIHNLIEKGYKRDLKLKQSELDILQEQLNPHFLYNTLSSLQALILKENKSDSMKLIKELSEFYRLCLNKGLSIISIQDELRLIHTYINIQNIRFRNTIHYQYDIQCKDQNFNLPKLLLQPFIENSIQHGKVKAESILNIYIKIEQLGQEYLITIEDDGVGIEKYYEGYGITNVRQRMQLYFKQSKLELEPITPHGTRVILHIGQMNEGDEGLTLK